MKNKTIAFVVSYNRPLQCDLALKSLKLHCTDYEGLDVQVLYKYDSKEIYDLYAQVSKENEGVIFIPEVTFQTNVSIALMDYTWVLFITDDTIFIHNFTVGEITKFLKKNKNVLGFSLRLGLNLDFCYSLNKKQAIPEYKCDKNVVLWDWKNAELDWNYPLEVSSSVYRVEQIQTIISNLQYWNTPNIFEWLMDQNKGHFVEEFPMMACYEKSVAFANPIHKVRKDNQNRSGDNSYYSMEALLQKYEKGVRIDPEQFEKVVPTACHMEVPFREIK